MSGTFSGLEQPSVRRKLYGLLGILLSSAVLGWLLVSINALWRFENVLWDFRLKIIARHTPHDALIKVIAIDQKSLDEIAEEDKYGWPWPRDFYSRVIDFLQRAGARGVAFDMIFSEPSHHGVEDDRYFAEAINSKLPVIVATVMRSEQQRGDRSRLERFVVRQRETNRRTGFAQTFLTHPAQMSASSVLLPVEQLIENASAFGNVSSPPDDDGIFRHTRAGGFVADTPILSLPFALLHAVHPEFKPNLDDGQRDASGRLSVRFAGGEATYETFSMVAILKSMANLDEGKEPLVPFDTFRDSYVFVGPTAPGLHDLRQIPLAEKYPGVEFNATVLDNLLHQRFIRKTADLPIANAMVILLVALISLAISSVTLFVQRYLLALFYIAALYFGYSYLSVWLGIQGYWLPLAVPLVVMTFALLASMALQYQLEGRQARFIKDAFQHYVSKGVIEEIIRDPASLSLGGEKRELTIFFSDIQGFTSISERMEASTLVALLNEFLSEMTSVVLESGGTVDKYVGDAIVAFWNAPLPVPQHAEQAVRAALRCQQRLIELESGLKQRFGTAIRMRIGIHTGQVSVGNFGSRERFNYTVIGDAANLASRLEGANKYFSTLTLVSGATRDAIGSIMEFRKVADIRVVGRREPVPVYEPLELGITGEQLQPYRSFEAALALYEQRQLEQALEAFSVLVKDPVARVYVTRIERDLKKGTLGAEWSSVWSLTDK
jgi:adenylate cyclase